MEENKNESQKKSGLVKKEKKAVRFAENVQIKEFTRHQNDSILEEDED